MPERLRMAKTDEEFRQALADNLQELKIGINKIRDEQIANNVHQTYILSRLEELGRRLDHIEPHAVQMPEISQRVDRHDQWIQRANGFLMAWTVIGPIMGGVAGFMVERVWKG